MDPSAALSSIPAGLRTPLLKEYGNIVQNYMERRWSPTELSGGRFCEIVYTILHGHATGSYASKPSKPRDFVSACRGLESNTHVPRSFQILIPRILPALYEVRSNRGVGHVGGDVDPNHMDATVVLSMCNWVMSELVRVLHGLSTQEAQTLVDALTERRVPLVWQRGSMKRVLDPDMKLRDQVLLLVASASDTVTARELQMWCDYTNTSYFKKVLKKLHQERMIEWAMNDGDLDGTVEILPPGSTYVTALLAEGEPVQS